MYLGNKPLKRVFSYWQLYLFLIIPIAYIITFAYIPMAGVQLAFKQFDPLQGIWGSPWVGLKNFVRFFTSYQFERVLTNTLKLSFYGLLAGFPIPIILALLLNAMRSEKFRKVVQTVTYLPHFISVVVIVGMLMQVLSPRVGAFGVTFTALTGADAPDLMGKPEAFSHLYVWSGIWQQMGWSSIIYMATLASVDSELHEAACIDGANRFKRVLYLDLPCILPTATIMLILSAGNIMNIGFEKVFLMQNSLNISASEVISTYVYRVGLAGSSGEFSYATAIGLFNSIVNFIMISSVNAFAKKFSSNSLW